MKIQSGFANPFRHYAQNLYVNGVLAQDVVIPSSVTNINAYAFYKYVGLRSIVVPSSVRVIGTYAFCECDNLTSVKISSGVVDIGTYAFYSCDNLTNINIPSSVTSIGECAFRRCRKLEDIEIPISVTSIERSTFAACDSLTNVKIPTSVKVIGYDAFEGCSSLSVLIILNPFCRIYHSNNIPSHTVIHGYDDSTAESYAEENDRIFVSLGTAPEISIASLIINNVSGKVGDILTVNGTVRLNYGGTVSETLTKLIEKIIWTSSDSEIAEVTKCSSSHISDNQSANLSIIVTPYKAGTVTITGTTSNGLVASCEVTVKDDTISEFTLEPSKNGSINETFSIFGSLKLPETSKSELLQQEIDAITWTSSNPVVAEVTGCTGENSSDNCTADLTVTFTSKMEGTATITGTTSNGLTASCEVTVTDDRKTVTVKDYTFYVTNTSGKPIYNASVSVGVDTVDTDDKGKAVFSSLKAKEDENGALSFDLDVSAMGYADFVEYGYAINENHVTYIMMLTISEADEDNGAMLQKNDCFESVLFKDAMFGNIDLMVNQKTISLSEPGNTFDLKVKAKENVRDAIRKYSIFSGGRRVVESQTGEFKDLRYSLFEADKKVYILLDVEPGDGKYERMPTQRQQINLLVKNPGESAKTPIGSLSFGESLQFTVPENTPFIGGATFDLAKLNMPLDLKLSTDGSFMISVNTDDAKLIDKNSVLFKDADKDKDKVKKELKEKEVVDDSLFGMYKSAVEKSAENLANGKDEESFQNKELKFSDSFRFSTKIGGYISGKLNDSVRKGTGYLYIQVKSSYSANADFVVISVPVTVGIEVGATGKASAKIQADFTDPTKSIGDSVSAEILFYLAPYVKVSAGPGCSEVNVKLNGGFTLPINYYMMGEKKGLESIVLEADAKVSGKLFCLEKEWELVSGRFNVYTRADKKDNAKKRSQTLSGGSLFSANDVSDLQVADYSRLAADDGWNSSSVKEAGTLTLDEAVSGYARTKTVSAGDMTLMVYRDANAGRDAYNADTLYYSIYDRTTGIWSEPKQVDGNDTADYDFDLYADGSDIYLLYQEMDREILPSDSLEDMARATGISFARFNTETRAFDVTRLVEGGSYCMSPSIVKNGSVLTAFWVENSVPDYYALNNTNDVRCRTYENGKWSETATLLENSCKVCELEGCVLDGKTYLAYITDLDNNLSTFEDRNVFLSDLGGQKVKLTDGKALNANLVYSKTDGDSGIYWYRDNSIVALSSAGGTPEELVAGLEINPNEDFSILTDGTSRAILFTEKNPSSEKDVAEAYLMYRQEDGTYANPIQVTEEGGCIGACSGTLVNGVALLNYRQDAYTYEGNTVNVESKLCTALVQDFSKIVLENLEYDYDTMNPGEKLTLSAEVKNAGNHPVTSLDVSVLAPSGQNVSESQCPVDLGVGQVQKLSFAIDVPKDLAAGNYVLQLSESGKELSEPASAEFCLLYSDVSISADLVTLGGNPFISAVVENRGDLSTTAAVSLVNCDDLERVIASYSTERIGSHSYETVLIPITGEMLTSGGIYSDFMVAAVSEEEDAYQYNNSAMVQVGSYVKEMSLEEESFTLQQGSRKTLKVIMDALGTPKFKYEWQSSDRNVAKVDGMGTVTAVAPGMATVTVMTEQGDFAQCTVNVVENNGKPDDGKPDDGTSNNGNVTVNKPSISKLQRKPMSFTVKWNRQMPVSGYQVQYSTDKKFTKKGTKTKTIKKVSVTELTVKNLKANKKYYVRVRAYKTVNGRNYYSGWSEAKNIKTLPEEVSISKLSAKRNGFSIKWRNYNVKLSGYEIAYSTSRKFANKNTKKLTVKNRKITSKMISKLKAKKKYYVKIRTYKTVKVNGKLRKVYSDWSKVKAVTTKK